MPLSIPEGYLNHHMTINNTAGGISSRSSIAIAYETTGTFGQTEFARITNLIRDGLTPRYDTAWIMGPSYGVARFGGVLVRFDDTGTEAGTHAAQTEASPAVSIVVSKVTGAVGRSFHGRFYLPCPDEQNVDGAGIVSGAEVNAWQASMDALQAALIADTAIDDLALLHDVASPFAGAPTTIASLRVRNVVGTMRPRQRR